MLNMKQKNAMAAGSVALLVGLGVLVADDKLNSLRGRAYDTQRSLSTYLGNGDCEWTEPIKIVPDELDLWKTLLVGFPSGDKRMAYVQMEALTGLPSKDDWDFVFNGYSNAPFIKSNYPNAAGIWSWDTEADQVALVVQYIRRSLVEFSDVMWYMSFEEDYNKDRVKVEELYGQRHDVNGKIFPSYCVVFALKNSMAHEKHVSLFQNFTPGEISTFSSKSTSTDGISTIGWIMGYSVIPTLMKLSMRSGGSSIDLQQFPRLVKNLFLFATAPLARRIQWLPSMSPWIV